MSWTLFKYIFKDLLRIFLMASGALAGIMSFGGLLRPLTQNGLDGSQVALLLANFMPAMSTYSLPVAALFATTMVYGRLSADNEVTACRASGISYAVLTLPALILGFCVAGMSAYLLCFTVPRATLKAEQVIYSNLAKVIAHEIEQTHRVDMPDGQSDKKMKVFARRAYLPPTTRPGVDPQEQAVVLESPLIVQYIAPPGKPKWYQQAKAFWSSSEAIARIVQDPEDGSAELTVTLKDGVVFPRTVGVGDTTQGAAATASFGPVSIPSKVGEKTKFLDVRKLKMLERDPSRGQQVQQVLQQFIRSDQAASVQEHVLEGLHGPGHQAILRAIDQTVSITVPPTASVAPSAKEDGTLLISVPGDGAPVQFREESGGQVRLSFEARACVMKFAVLAGQTTNASVTVRMQNAIVDPGDDPDDDEIPALAPVNRRYTVPLSAETVAWSDRTAAQYLKANFNDNQRALRAQRNLRFAWFDLTNHISSELHARAAFVVSCLLLVLVGSSLGMMFRSGNFLTAFAVSVVPAMLSVVLIVTGQHTAESTPTLVTAANNPLHLGLLITWSGNIAIAVAAVVLLTRLQKR